MDTAAVPIPESTWKACAKRGGCADPAAADVGPAWQKAEPGRVGVGRRAPNAWKTPTTTRTMRLSSAWAAPVPAEQMNPCCAPVGRLLRHWAHARAQAVEKLQAQEGLAIVSSSRRSWDADGIKDEGQPRALILLK